jgi:YVTN family beta-propeller protein
VRLAVRCFIAIAWLASSGCPANEAVELVFSLDEDAFWNEGRTPAPLQPGDGRLLVTNSLDDTVSVLDLSSVEAGAPVVIATVPVGSSPVEREGPHHLVADAAGAFYYVGISLFVPGGGSGPHGVHGAGNVEGRALKLRADDNVQVGSVRVDRNPGDIRLSPDGGLLAVSHFDLLRVQEALSSGDADPSAFDSRVIFIDPETMTRARMVSACPAAHGVAFSLDGSRLVASCFSDEIAVMNMLDPGYAVTRISVLDEPGDIGAPVCSPYATTIDPLGETAWVSCFASGEVIAIDLNNGARDGRVVPLNGRALFGTFNADGTILAIAAHSDQVSSVAFIDAATGAVQSSALLFPEVCEAAHVATYVDEDLKVAVVCEGNHSDPGTLVVIDAAAPHAILGHTTLGIYPDDIALLRRKP